MLTKLTPIGASGKRILTTNTYTLINGLTRLTKTSTCAVGECGSVKEQVVNYSYWQNTNLIATQTTTNGTGSLSQTITNTYDNAGRLLVSDGPLSGLSDASYSRYDLSGRNTWAIGPVNESGFRAAQRMTYRPQDNAVLSLETGSLSSATSSALAVVSTTTNTYNAHGLLLTSKVSSPTESKSLTQNTYDSSNRVNCSATRMNPAKFTNLPSSACTLGTEGV